MPVEYLSASSSKASSGNKGVLKLTMTPVRRVTEQSRVFGKRQLVVRALSLPAGTRSQH
jgi:hypothetical protein